MDYNTQTILGILQDSEGFDIASPYTLRLAKKIARNIARNIELQHHIKGLQREVSLELENMGVHLVKRNVLKKLKSMSGGLKFGKILTSSDSLLSLPVLNIKFQLPNLSAGKPFKEVIKPLDDLGAGKLQFFCASGFDAIKGLSIDEANLTVEGIVDKGGDYQVEVWCSLLLPTGERQRVQGKLKITVVPDPRLLWKDIPADATARFHKPDIASGSCTTDKALLIAASVRGRSHAHKGIHRDDDIKMSCSSTSGWHIICVADGAGSCQYSRRGAELAVMQSTKTLRETLDSHYGLELERLQQQYFADKNDDNYRLLQGVFQHTIVKAVFNAAKAIQTEVKNNEGDTFKDYSTTLLLAAHKAVDDGYLVISFWIGDGAAVLYDKGKSVILLGEPDSGEYAGQTRFLDTALFDTGDVYTRVSVQKVETMSALILATDGVTDAKFETEKQLASIADWDTLWAELEPIISNEDLDKAEQDLIKWLNFWSPGNHDDRSIAISYIKE